MLVLVNVLKVFFIIIKDCRIDVDVDSCVFINVWEGQGSKGFFQLIKVIRDCFFELLECNLQFCLSYVKFSNNFVDDFFCWFFGLDLRLLDEIWSLVEQIFC